MNGMKRSECVNLIKTKKTTQTNPPVHLLSCGLLLFLSGYFHLLSLNYFFSYILYLVYYLLSLYYFFHLVYFIIIIFLPMLLSSYLGFLIVGSCCVLFFSFNCNGMKNEARMKRKESTRQRNQPTLPPPAHSRVICSLLTPTFSLPCCSLLI